MPKSRKRKQVRDRQAHAARSAQEGAAEAKRLTAEQYVRRRVLGWGLIVLGSMVGVSHYLAHLGLLYEDRALWDLTIGYPTAGALAIAGIMVLSKT